jgi:hypothetical protein
MELFEKQPLCVYANEDLTLFKQGLTSAGELVLTIVNDPDISLLSSTKQVLSLRNKGKIKLGLCRYVYLVTSSQVSKFTSSWLGHVSFQNLKKMQVSDMVQGLYVKKIEAEDDLFC